MGEDAEVVDFEDLDEESKENQRRRRSCMVSNFGTDALSQSFKKYFKIY